MSTVTPDSPALTLDGLVLDWAIRDPRRPLLRVAGRTIDGITLSHLAEATAAQLDRWGIGPGDRVALWGQNSLAWVAWMLGASRCGAAVVALHPSLTRDEFADSLAQSRSRWLLLDATARGRSLLDVAREVTGHVGDGVPAACAPGCLQGVSVMSQGDGAFDHALLPAGPPRQQVSLSEPDRIAALLFTSGSSGKPKLVQLSHKALVLNAVRTARAAGFTGDDRIASPLPLYHSAGLSSGLALSLATGALWCSQPRFSAKTLLAEIDDSACTVVQGVPTMFKALVAACREHGHTPRTLRAGFIGGAPVTASMCAETMQALGLSFMCVAYGLSEFGPTVSLNPSSDAQRLDSVGHPIEGVELRVVDAQTQSLQPDGEPGEIQVRGDTLMQGYLDNEEATRAAITPDGWLRTGDLGSVDAGRLQLFGRLKALIIRGGENISPGEIEAVLAEAPGVHDVCVVGTPSAHWGETVSAVVQPVDACSFDLGVVERYAQERLSRYKRPEHFVVCHSLPLLSSGKVDRKAVLQVALEHTKSIAE